MKIVYIFKKLIKTFNYHKVVPIRRNTISDESRLYRQICDVCKRIVEGNAEFANKFNRLSDKRKNLFYAKLVYLVAKNLDLPMTYSWYLWGPMPSVQQMAIRSIQKTPLQGARKKDPKLFSEVKKCMCLLDDLGVFEADSFLVNFYAEYAPEPLRGLYLTKEDLMRDPNNENFARFETELALLKTDLKIPANIFEMSLEFGILYSNLNDIRFRNMDWMLTYLKVISQYVTIYSMSGPRKDDEIKRKLAKLPKDIKQLGITIEELRSKLHEKDNAVKLNSSVAVRDAGELLS